MNLDPDRTPTKGAVERVVYVPYDLGRQLAQYVTFARGPLLKEYRKRVGERQKSTSVFLNKHGEPVSLAGIQNEFQRASRESGVKATPHVLRHTYATYEFLRLSEREGRDRALLWVKDRLGHSSIQTTEIYLHAADLVSHEETDNYHAEIYAILRDGEDDGRKPRVSKTKAGRETAPHRS
jgi:site-specific recombinase XerD